MTMLKKLGLFAALITWPVAVQAGPLAYPTGPYDTVQNLVNGVITNLNTNSTPQATLNGVCSGTTTVTCQGLRLKLAYSGLTTAASTLSAAQTVTDASVTATSQVICSTTGYAGAGVPVIVNIVPAAGSFAYNIQNVSTGAALNATVNANCLVFN